MSNLKFIQVGDSFNAIGLNVVWVIIGLITIYAGIKNLLDKRIRQESEPLFSGALSVSFVDLVHGSRQRFLVCLF